ncbi:MAG: hypothetical protein AB7K09_13075, partial [Planctomycetota bacterium]
MRSVPLPRSVERMVAVALLALLTAAASGCGGEATTTTTTIVLPTPGTEILTSQGGSAAGQATFNGGNGGNVTITATNGRIMEDDGRSKPTVTTNALTGYAGTISYADLQAIDTANANVTLVEVAPTATMTITGEDFFLASGSTLDLSGITAGINSLVVNCDTGIIRIEGNIITTRTGAVSVGLAFTSGATGPVAATISVSGTVTTSGADEQSAGPILFQANAGSLHVTGKLNAVGGASVGTAIAGNGGDIALTANA